MTDNASPSTAVGRVILLGILALIVLICGFGIWSTTARINGSVISPGKVEVERNRQVVQHPRGGVVAEILVDNGTLVAAQDVLLRLDTTSAMAELALVQEQLFELTARQGRLRAEASGAAQFTQEPMRESEVQQAATHAALIAGQKQLFDVNRKAQETQAAQLRQQQGQIRVQIVGIEAEKEAVEAELALLRTELQLQQDLLDKGWSQAKGVLQLRREVSELEGRHGALIASRAQAEERIIELDMQALERAAVFRANAATALDDLQAPLRRLRHEAHRLTQEIAAADIRAPTSGIVYQLEVQTPRAVVRAAEPLMHLVPQDRQLVIATQISPRHIDQLRLGQKVKMRLSAFNARTTPEVIGRIRKISADAIENQLPGGYYYRVEVELDAGELARLPEGAALLPGMPVETFIQTGDRSPMAYLMKPISDYLARALRES